MTYIPGTDKKYIDNNNNKPETISILNIEELKKSKIPKIIKAPLKWHEKLHYWILFGFAGGIIFVLLSLFNIRFLYLAPLCPISAIICWFIKEIFRKPIKNNNIIS